MKGDHQQIWDLPLDSLLSIFVPSGRGLCPVPPQTGAEAELGASRVWGSCCPPALAFCPRQFQPAQLLPQEGVSSHSTLRPHCHNTFPSLIVVFFVESFSRSFTQRQECFPECEAFFRQSEVWPLEFGSTSAACRLWSPCFATDFLNDKEGRGF